jgi:hypothetical protein
MKNIVIDSDFDEKRIYALGLFSSLTDIVLASIINSNASVHLHFHRNIEIPPIKKDMLSEDVPSFIDQTSEHQLLLLNLKGLQAPFFAKIKSNVDFLLISNFPLNETKSRLKLSEIQMIIDIDEQTLKPRLPFLKTLFG